MTFTKMGMIAGAMALMSTGQAFAMGDAAEGEAQFRQCQSCHVVQNEAGETLAGRAGRQGPNLYGVIGRQAGTVEDFRYGPDLVAAGEQGLVWDETNIVAYLEDPTGFLREFTGDNNARSRMSYRMRNGAEDMAAFLATFSQ
ncbi:cytochrome c [Rubricella aquisinus]|uniref:Cytochrome c n=1 Tax=Rubricella aquisinus TaxID=2028108 RepID=A0A840WWG1_9RHOB|nr:cytochrome C [Rubricella aquisinus]MBB5514046.1 cytochrome c [Rubricella aquisinus]